MTDRALIIDVNVEAGDWAGALPDFDALIERVLNAAAATCILPAQAEVSVLLTDDAHQKVLNRDWRGKDKPTNVLSFPGGDGGDCCDDGAFHHPDQPTLLGDISIALETTGREAQDQQKNLSEHFSHLLVHGMLHLLGFDHETQEDADEMEPLEIEVLAELGIANPYADRPSPDRT